jgi:hypothetical protein
MPNTMRNGLITIWERTLTYRENVRESKLYKLQWQHISQQRYTESQPDLVRTK